MNDSCITYHTITDHDMPSTLAAHRFSTPRTSTVMTANSRWDHVAEVWTVSLLPVLGPNKSSDTSFRFFETPEIQGLIATIMILSALADLSFTKAESPCIRTGTTVWSRYARIGRAYDVSRAININLTPVYQAMEWCVRRIPGDPLDFVSQQRSLRPENREVG